MLRKSTKVFAIISSTCLLLSLLAYGFFLHTVSKQKANHIAHAEARAESSAHKKSIQDLMRTLDETSVERESLKARFVEEEGVIDVLSLIESLGEEQNVLLTTNSLNVQPVNEYFETLAINITVEGRYEQVLNVLSLLEKLPYQTAIHNAQVSRRETGIWGGVFDIRITKFTKYED